MCMIRCLVGDCFLQSYVLNSVTENVYVAKNKWTDTGWNAHTDPLHYMYYNWLNQFAFCIPEICKWISDKGI